MQVLAELWGECDMVVVRECRRTVLKRCRQPRDVVFRRGRRASPLYFVLRQVADLCHLMLPYLCCLSTRGKAVDARPTLHIVH